MAGRSAMTASDPKRTLRHRSPFRCARSAQADGWVIAWSHIWAAPILLDPSWSNSDYYGKAEPVAGLATALAGERIAEFLARK